MYLSFEWTVCKYEKTQDGRTVCIFETDCEIYFDVSIDADEIDWKPDQFVFTAGPAKVWDDTAQRFYMTKPSTYSYSRGPMFDILSEALERDEVRITEKLFELAAEVGDDGY